MPQGIVKFMWRKREPHGFYPATHEGLCIPIWEYVKREILWNIGQNSDPAITP
jgi:hypothetical protein